MASFTIPEAFRKIAKPFKAAPGKMHGIISTLWEKTKRKEKTPPSSDNDGNSTANVLSILDEIIQELEAKRFPQPQAQAENLALAIQPHVTFHLGKAEANKNQPPVSRSHRIFKRFSRPLSWPSFSINNSFNYFIGAIQQTVLETVTQAYWKTQQNKEQLSMEQAENETREANRQTNFEQESMQKADEEGKALRDNLALAELDVIINAEPDILPDPLTPDNSIHNLLGSSFEEVSTILDQVITKEAEPVTKEPIQASKPVALQPSVPPTPVQDDTLMQASSRPTPPVRRLGSYKRRAVSLDTLYIEKENNIETGYPVKKGNWLEKILHFRHPPIKEEEDIVLSKASKVVPHTNTKQVQDIGRYYEKLAEQEDIIKELDRYNLRCREAALQKGYYVPSRSAGIGVV